MAVWQIRIELLPKAWAEQHQYQTDLLYDDEGYDTSCAWLSNQPDKDVDSIFDKVLDKTKSWSEDLTLWGNTETNDISLWREDGQIESIGFRLDLREDIMRLMSSLVDSAIELDCVLFIPEQKLLCEPNVLELKKYILKSNAAKFVKDPEGFFTLTE